MPVLNESKYTLNKFKFYSVTNLPTNEELKEYYAETYYQKSKGAYQTSYSPKELQLFRNKLEEKFFVIQQHNPSAGTFLDIGCGEGWALSFFKEKDFDVLGLDFSSFGCESFNKDCVDFLMTGDIYESIDTLISQGRKFDVIWMSNLLEHVIDPLLLLKDCSQLINKNGILVIIVPNDFSRLQKHLLDNNFVNREYWVALPDHLSYFNSEGLHNICKAADWEQFDLLTDYPIDFALLNDNTNYIMDKSKGKSVHHQRVEAENLFYEASLEKTVKYYRALADLGFGRELIGFFTKKS